MKTKKRTPAEREILHIFKEIYQDEDSCNEAMREIKKAFSYVKQDALYRSMNFNNME